MSRSILTLTTDFGSGSPYVAQIKGVILSIHPHAVLVDITHDIAPQDVRQGALVLEDVTPRFPESSIHVAVVDPGVGTDRRVLAAEIGRRYYIAPDNGLLGRLIGRDPDARVMALTKREYWLSAVSATFHGRDILAPVAAHLSLGTALEELGEAWDQPVQVSWPEAVVEKNRLQGEIIAIDTFGNLISNITQDLIAATRAPDAATVHCGGRTISGIVATYGQRPPGTPIALVGSSNRLEIAVVNGNAAVELRAQVGEAVSVILPS
ncbi:MAG TPA: SAM-dependent chlorinase/fluorinase [Candidatus Anammoximicrobium sp.]|mgnify:CR=1 FL=1|nr:SAM-dependent chlorinase/fluorinase [Candidatus Anammoximicrobium sp.]